MKLFVFDHSVFIQRSLLLTLSLFHWEALSQPEVSPEFGGTIFFLVRQELSFDAAKAACVERDGTLARISNAIEHSIVNSLFEDPVESPFVWIGMILYFYFQNY